ncbi:hypothetical protein F2Q70_00010938 [Brassica cretica]|uniref:ATP-dependent RNA helicase n=1 Tax=Brassica cretica TaxID=69181 RepID=A0A8S9M8Z4_BRACR|nr:hypothetical protein F2Q70_00010938 [Brassica cretica]
MQTNPCQILVATPGRLKDHIENTPGFETRLKGVKVLVLDEADHLLDMGFRKDIERILSAVPKERQTFLFSATVPEEVRQMCLVALRRDHEFINCVHEGTGETHQQVRQTHMIASLDKHFSLLYTLLRAHIADNVNYKVIVFCTTAMVTKLVADLLGELNLNVREIHSRKPQSYRTRVSNEFRKSKGLILVTSDVSARGVDYPDVTLVLQVGLPKDREQYIHRLGRTGRKGKEGEGMLLLAPWEEYFLSSLKDLPITKSSLPSTDPETVKKVQKALCHVEMRNKEAAYQAWLGYYNSQKMIGRDKERLVELANEFSRSMGLDNPPAIPKLILEEAAVERFKVEYACLLRCPENSDQYLQSVYLRRLIMAFAPILRRASAAKSLFSLSRLSLGSSPSVRSLQTGASGDDRQPPPPPSPSSIAGYHVSSGGYMRGAVYREPNQPLTIEEFHIPRPKLPSIEVVVKSPPTSPDNKRPPILALVICPTRELANQAATEANTLLKHHPTIGVQVVIGGTRLGLEQKRMQTNPCQILVATPGRLKDHIENTSGFETRLKGVKVLVLDEADHLLDMGFRKDIERILTAVPKERQTFLFSATVPEEVRQMCLVALRRDHEFINCVHEGTGETHQQVRQTHMIASLDKHFSLLYTLLRAHIADNVDYKVIVFCTTAMVTKLVADLLGELNLNVREIHSRKPQSYRTRVSNEFRKSKGLILVTSDVSARGVDYPDVTLVLQVGLPKDREQYIHRLGRTGRKGKEGEGILLLAPWEEYFLSSLKDLPITKSSLPSTDPETVKKVQKALCHVEMRNKEAAYQAWLGYYNSQKMIGRDKERLVELANEFSRSMGLDNPPAIPKLILGKMGLKNQQNNAYEPRAQKTMRTQSWMNPKPLGYDFRKLAWLSSKPNQFTSVVLSWRLLRFSAAPPLLRTSFHYRNSPLVLLPPLDLFKPEPPATIVNPLRRRLRRPSLGIT